MAQGPSSVDHLTRHAADRLHHAWGTSGRPAVVGSAKDEHDNMVLVYADGCLARRVPVFTRARSNDWKWEAMEGPDYDLLFVRDTVQADD